MKTVFCFLSLLFLMASCARSPQTETRLEISFGSLNGGAFYPGGLFLEIYNSETELSHRFELTNSYTVELPVGLWSFRVVGFHGPGQWQGTTECGGVENVDLSGESATVAIKVSPLNCSETGYLAMLAAKNAAPTAFWDTAKWDQATWAP
jgi:hypothetical protein